MSVHICCMSVGALVHTYCYKSCICISCVLKILMHSQCQKHTAFLCIYKKNDHFVKFSAWFICINFFTLRNYKFPNNSYMYILNSNFYIYFYKIVWFSTVVFAQNCWSIIPFYFRNFALLYWLCSTAWLLIHCRYAYAYLHAVIPALMWVGL